METLLNNKRFIKVSIVFMVLLSLLTLAKFIDAMKRDGGREHGSLPPNVITVTGTADVMATPDIATLDLTVTKDGVTTKEAQDLLNQSVTKVIAYLKDQKIDDKDVKSQYGGVNPKYTSGRIECFAYPCPQPSPKVSGYTATQSINVKIRSTDAANDIRTGLANLGITDINGPTFTIDNEDGLKDQARAKAIENARAKAKELARELDVRLGDVTSFSENNNSGPIMYAAKVMNQAAGMDAVAPAPVLPKGQNKITSDVTITYEIR